MEMTGDQEFRLEVDHSNMRSQLKQQNEKRTDFSLPKLMSYRNEIIDQLVDKDVVNLPVYGA